MYTHAIRIEKGMGWPSSNLRRGSLSLLCSHALGEGINACLPSPPLSLLRTLTY